jgi:hypothetical protein
MHFGNCFRAFLSSTRQMKPVRAFGNAKKLDECDAGHVD